MLPLVFIQATNTILIVIGFSKVDDLYCCHISLLAEELARGISAVIEEGIC